MDPRPSRDNSGVARAPKYTITIAIGIQSQQSSRSQSAGKSDLYYVSVFRPSDAGSDRKEEEQAVGQTDQTTIPSIVEISEWNSDAEFGDIIAVSCPVGFHSCASECCQVASELSPCPGGLPRVAGSCHFLI